MGTHCHCSLIARPIGHLLTVEVTASISGPFLIAVLSGSTTAPSPFLPRPRVVVFPTVTDPGILKYIVLLNWNKKFIVSPQPLLRLTRSIGLFPAQTLMKDQTHILLHETFSWGLP